MINPTLFNPLCIVNNTGTWQFHATSGSEALAVGAGLKPEVIILDMLMPGMNGLETLYQPRQSLPENRIIILSMSDEDVYVHSGALHGGGGVQCAGG